MTTETYRILKEGHIVADGLDARQVTAKLRQYNDDDLDTVDVLAYDQGYLTLEKCGAEWLAGWDSDDKEYLNPLTGLDQDQMELRLKYLRSKYNPEHVAPLGQAKVSHTDNSLRQVCEGLLLEVQRLQEMVRGQAARIEVLENQLRAR